MKKTKAARRRLNPHMTLERHPKALKHAPDPRHVLSTEEWQEKEEDENMLRILKEWGHEFSDALTMEQKLHFCSITKDGQFSCVDHTVVPLLKSVAAMKSSVLKTTFTEMKEFVAVQKYAILHLR